MTGSSLAPRHRSMLLGDSAISPEVVEARDYRTVETKAELEKLGFGRAQQNTPGLLIPLYGPDGRIVLHQFRPDEPRVKKDKPVKYETPSGSRMVLDVPPAARDRLDDPSTPLFVTEGVKKGDALASRELCIVSLIGVWNWRGTNEKGGKVCGPSCLSFYCPHDPHTPLSRKMSQRSRNGEEVKKMTKIRILAVGALVVFALALPQAALADPGTNNCWGTVSSQRASTEHDIGEHASAQDEPRAGLGNLAQDLGISVGEVGAFLASVDDLEATRCP